jgi:hypothetical protein
MLLDMLDLLKSDNELRISHLSEALIGRSKWVFQRSEVGEKKKEFEHHGNQGSCRRSGIADDFFCIRLFGGDA